MPGVLTRQQLDEQIDLDHWLLFVRGIIVHMEVFILSLFHLNLRLIDLFTIRIWSLGKNQT